MRTNKTPPPQPLYLSYVDKIMDGIGQIDKDRNQQLIDDLIEDNAIETGNPHGFLYGGNFFSHLEPKSYRLVTQEPLHASLRERGDQLVAALRQFKNDSQMLRQGLTVLLRDCETDQDFKDALPNAIAMVLPEFSQLKRTREVAWTLKEKPLLFDQYRHTEELLTYYLSSRILF